MAELAFAWLGPEPVPYQAGWDLQKRLHAARVDDRVGDTVLLLEHEPVYTAGKRTRAPDRPVVDPGAPVIDIDRGGKITWHGPGQLTGYPIVRLSDPIDVLAHVRALEEVMIRTIADFGLTGVRVEGKSGVWLDPDPRRGLIQRKVGAIGCRVSRGVGMHGFALNCANDLSWYSAIVPCGIPVDEGDVTSLTRELGREIPVAEVLPPVRRHLAAVFGATSTTSSDGVPEIPEPASHTLSAV
ncbi:lipoyl(octanoyl) transferase LipB [Spiractinospora alimapuensis]|uniref:lipoyl(octanoyl) transferase LipB n=1 Tax=Spiractinospora alimapuensis TaxID=2820884 RepID=UPI001F1AFEA0|nr:lipoyl(octanoyl) transferase LipB [Spiractinospora alimapuensis]QVQ53263.1 lipoyl(octanoyl) transferase LipB [Spiractinospora alimapuensis]